MSTERDTQILSIGKQCSHPSCLLVDFLPFKCQHCEDAFCQEHFMVSAHHCPKYDENKHNRVAPDCVSFLVPSLIFCSDSLSSKGPFCHTPVAVRPNQDPNARMEEHFNNECSVMSGKTSKVKSTPVCARGNCKKVLFQPIQCTVSTLKLCIRFFLLTVFQSCKDQFCPAHRFPADHNCTPVVSSNAKLGVANPFANTNTKNLNSKASAAGAATMGAIKKAMSSATAAAPSKPAPIVKAPPPKPSTFSTTSNPFSKTDRYVPSLSSFISNRS
jgi:predicted nucleic acid binding AN1-type Zn finger protein